MRRQSPPGEVGRDEPSQSLPLNSVELAKRRAKGPQCIMSLAHRLDKTELKEFLISLVQANYVCSENRHQRHPKITTDLYLDVVH